MPIIMPITMRTYRGDEDIERVRALLRETFELEDRPGGNWHVADFDYWRWHCLENVVERPPDDLLLWEDENERLVAVALQGDPGVVHFQIHPAHRTAALGRAMIDAAEAQYAAPMPDGKRRVYLWTDVDDAERQSLLRERGYETYQSPHSRQRQARVDLARPLPEAPVPAGYVVRSMGGPEDLPARSLASWRAFHPDEPDDGCDPTGSWYRSVQRASLYDRDLDVVSVAPDGDIASFSTGYYDDASRTAVLVLAGTAPPHQRKGLAKAVVVEMLRRLRDRGAVAAYVSSYEPPAHALYRSAGFTDVVLAEAWRKTLPRI